MLPGATRLFAHLALLLTSVCARVCIDPYNRYRISDLSAGVYFNSMVVSIDTF